MKSPELVPLANLLEDVKPGFACGEESEDGVFQIRMNNITRSGTLDFGKRRRVPAGHKSIRTTLLRPNDILFNATNSPDLVGKTALFNGLDEQVVYSNHFLRLRADTSKADPGYLARWLHYEFKCGAFKAMCRQWVNQATVAKDALLGLSVPLPSIPEQQAVSRHLYHVEGMRTKRQEALTLHDDLAASIFFEMFGVIGGDEAADLGDFLTFVTSGGRGWAKYYTETGSRFIRSLDVRMNEIEDQSAVYVTAPNNAEAKRTRVHAGDVLLTITGSLIGRVAPIPEQLEGSYISQHVAILRTNQAALDPEFLSFFMSLPSGGQRQIERMQYGQTKPGLNFEQIRAMRIPLPTLDEQRLFTRKLGVVRKLLASHREYLSELDALSASIQHRAFGGGM